MDDGVQFLKESPAKKIKNMKTTSKFQRFLNRFREEYSSVFFSKANEPYTCMHCKAKNKMLVVSIEKKKEGKEKIVKNACASCNAVLNVEVENENGLFFGEPREVERLKILASMIKNKVPLNEIFNVGNKVYEGKNVSLLEVKEIKHEEK